ASILFLQKLNPNQIMEEIRNNYSIFFGIIENIGYEGTKIGKIVYKRNESGEIIKDEKGISIINEDITEITKAYINFREKKKLFKLNKIFLRDYNEIKERFDPKFYQPMYKELREKLLKAGAVPLEKVVNIVSKKAQILKNPEATIKYFEISDVNPIFSEVFSYNQMKVYEAPSRASYEVKKGDVITAVAGVSTGTTKHASVYITEEFDGCICTNGFRVLRTKNEDLNVDPLYLLYYLRSKEFLMQMYQYRTGATIPAVSDTDLKKILILIPEKRIQDEFAKKVKRSYSLRRESQKIMNKLGDTLI
ncbi:MAG: restriction endonuclease subunit S, partial [Candidatus Hodarchaeota archaeon]